MLLHVAKISSRRRTSQLQSPSHPMIKTTENRSQCPATTLISHCQSPTYTAAFPKCTTLLPQRASHHSGSAVAASAAATMSPTGRTRAGAGTRQPTWPVAGKFHSRTLPKTQEAQHPVSGTLPLYAQCLLSACTGPPMTDTPAPPPPNLSSMFAYPSCDTKLARQ
jgi:hypothetical protein